jgi:hypothetical protein
MGSFGSLLRFSALKLFAFFELSTIIPLERVRQFGCNNA